MFWLVSTLQTIWRFWSDTNTLPVASTAIPMGFAKPAVVALPLAHPATVANAFPA